MNSALHKLSFLVALWGVNGIFPALPAQSLHHDMPIDSAEDSAFCLDCHDGLKAELAGYCTVDQRFNSPHVLFIPYPPPGREVEFRPLKFLQTAGIRLMNGRITCISCHNLANPKKPHLVVENN